MLTTNATGGLIAAPGARRAPDVKIGTFDLGPDVLKAVRGGRIAFAVDQQAYLQGYWPIEMLALRARYGIVPGQGDVIATGPNFVTRANAAAGDRAQPPVDPLTGAPSRRAGGG